MPEAASKDIVPYGERSPATIDTSKDVALINDHSRELAPVTATNSELVTVSPASSELATTQEASKALALREKEKAAETEKEEATGFKIGKIVLAGLDTNLDPRAKKMARDRLKEELKYQGVSGNIIKKSANAAKHMGKLIWKGAWARGTYIERYKHEAKQELVAKGDVYGTGNKDYVSSIVERFASDFEDEVIHQSAGERQHILKPESQGGNPEIRKAILDHIKQDVAGAFATPEAREEAKKQMMAQLYASGALDNTELSSALLFADNLEKVADTLKAKVSLDQLDVALADATIVLGEAKVGARGQARQTATEKILARTRAARAATQQGSGKGGLQSLAHATAHVPDTAARFAIPALFNEATIGSAVAMAVSATEWARDRALGVAARLVPGAAAAAIVGYREGKTLRDEYGHLGRQLAEGEINVADLKGRAAEIAKHFYERANATDLTNSLKGLYEPNGKLKAGSQKDIQEAFNRLANIKAQMHITDSSNSGEGKNLIVFSSKDPAAKEAERWALDLQLAQTKADLNEFLLGRSVAELTALGFSAEDIAAIDADTKQFTAGRITELQMLCEGVALKDIAAKEASFKKYQMRRTASQGVKAGIIGALLGITIAEAAAGFSETEGLFEADVAGPNSETLLDRVFEGPGGETATVEAAANTAKTTLIDLTPTSDINVPEGFTVTADAAAHTFSVAGPNNTTVTDLKLTAGGLIEQESLAKLQAAGVEVTASPPETIIETIAQEKQVSMNDFAERHSSEMTQIKHSGWLDNNTSRIFEKNEQGLNSPFRQEDGQVRLDIDRMTENGSIHGDKSVNWVEAARDGKMQIAVYADKAHYNEAFTFTIDENGRALIPTGHAAQQLFEAGQGRIDFSGLYIEAQYVESTSAAGQQNVWTLATEVGNKSKTVTDIFQQEVPRDITTYSFSTASPEIATGADTINLPYTAPAVLGRSGLKTGETNTAPKVAPTTPTPAAPTPPPATGPGREPLNPRPLSRPTLGRTANNGDNEILPPIDRSKGTVYRSNFVAGGEPGISIVENATNPAGQTPQANPQAAQPQPSNNGTPAPKKPAQKIRKIATNTPEFYQYLLDNKVDPSIPLNRTPFGVVLLPREVKDESSRVVIQKAEQAARKLLWQLADSNTPIALAKSPKELKAAKRLLRKAKLKAHEDAGSANNVNGERATVLKELYIMLDGVSVDIENRLKNTSPPNNTANTRPKTTKR